LTHPAALAAAILAAGTLAAFDATAQEERAGGIEVTEFDRPVGDPDAPVTIVEYASFTCTHCATFHNEVWPELKDRYVDTGEVYFLFRDFPLDGLALLASLLTRCVPDDAYHATVTELFRSQREWRDSDDPRERLLALGVFAGAEEGALEACMDNRALAEDIVRQLQAAEEQWSVSGTPTFVINGEILVGAQPIERFAEVIEPMLPGDDG
jgi:protein-disulfide isomerase